MMEGHGDSAHPELNMKQIRAYEQMYQMAVSYSHPAEMLNAFESFNQASSSPIMITLLRLLKLANEMCLNVADSVKKSDSRLTEKQDSKEKEVKETCVRIRQKNSQLIAKCLNLRLKIESGADESRSVGRGSAGEAELVERIQRKTSIVRAKLQQLKYKHHTKSTLWSKKEPILETLSQPLTKLTEASSALQMEGYRLFKEVKQMRDMIASSRT